MDFLIHTCPKITIIFTVIFTNTHIEAHAISNARNAIKLTQKELANKLRINEKIIKEYENCSVVNFSPNLYKRILKVLNVDPKLYI